MAFIAEIICPLSRLHFLRDLLPVALHVHFTLDYDNEDGQFPLPAHFVTILNAVTLFSWAILNPDWPIRFPALKLGSIQE
jgi:hypothetical protein